jgi:hypothetical protein
MPQEEQTWGKLEPFYSVTLDGRTTGAVFLGKKTIMDLKRSATFTGPASLELILNNKRLGLFNVDGDKGVKTELSVLPGINTMQMKWIIGGRVHAAASKTFLFFAM